MDTKFQTADIVMVHAKGFSWLRFITGMQFNHTLIIEERVFDDYETLESIDKGTAPTMLSNYIGQWIAIFRMKGITKEQQDEVILQLRKMGTYKYDYFLPFRVMKRLGIKGTIKTLLKLWSKDYPLNVPHIEDDWVVCSEYAQEGYEKSGIPIVPKETLFIPDSPLYPPACEKLDLVWQGCYQGA